MLLVVRRTSLSSAHPITHASMQGLGAALLRCCKHSTLLTGRQEGMKVASFYVT